MTFKFLLFFFSEHFQDQNLPSIFQQNNDSPLPQTNSTETSEDLIYLLTSILDQAKALHSKKGHDSRSKRGIKSYSRRIPRRDSIRSGKKTDSFEGAVLILMEEVRRETSSLNPDLSVDSVLVKEVLKWLYHAMDSNRPHLSSVLKPYLSRLFAVSHESCWHIEEWKRRQDNQELFALGKFARLVVEEELSPRDGITDAIRKGKTKTYS